MDRPELTFRPLREDDLPLFVGWLAEPHVDACPLHAAQLGAGPSEAGLDLAIGEPEWTGRGWGAVAIRRFVDEILLADGSVDVAEQGLRRLMRRRR